MDRHVGQARGGRRKGTENGGIVKKLGIIHTQKLKVMQAIR